MKRIILIVVSSLAVVTIFVSAKYFYFEKSMVHANCGIRAIAQEDTISSLFIGSSMFQLGINVTDIDPFAYQLCYSGNQPFTEELQLMELVGRGTDIDQVVVDMYPYTAANNLFLSDSRIIRDGDFRYTMKLYDIMKSEKGPSYLFNMVVQANNQIFITCPITDPLISAKYFRGSLKIHKPGSSREILDRLPIPEPYSNKLLGKQMKALDNIINFCREKSINIVFVESPKYYKIHEDQTYQSLMQEYTEFLMQRNVKIVVSEASYKHIIFPEEYRSIETYPFDHTNALFFADLIHCSGDGRMRFSRICADLL